MATTPDLAERIRHLPRCPKRGLPKPFVAGWNDDGTVDFKGLDPAAEDQLVAGRLCGLCGDPLGYWIVFLGDEACTGPDGVYVEPPLHEDCALFAMTSRDGCPYIRQEKVPWAPDGKPGDVLLCPADQVYAGPKRDWVMAYARGFRADWRRGGTGLKRVYLPAGQITRTRRFTYERGRLTECPAPAGPAVLVARTQPRKKTRGKR